MRYEMNSKEITNIRKLKRQTNGKTDGMGTRKILDDTIGGIKKTQSHVLFL
jgi:hypothetical protein